MNLSAPFIKRPVGTILFTVAIALVGMVAFKTLPVAPLPQIDFPTISVSASLPGASPEIMASSVATPLERQLGHIAGITEMTSSSYLGSTSITLQFDLDRNIDGAARDVQSAINAARTYLPANLPANPFYRKVNPADSPILILSLTSDIYDRAALFDAASTDVQQRLSQIPGVGQVIVGGSSLPAVRIEMNPTRVSQLGLSLPKIAALLKAENTDLPKGRLSNASTSSLLVTNDQLMKAVDYEPLIIGFQKGAAIHLKDVATVEDSVQDVRAAGYLNGKPAILLIVFRTPGANIIDTVDAVTAAMPSLKASIAQGIKISVVLDRTKTIRASVSDVERTLIVSILLVIVVVFVFLRNARATFIPSVTVPVSLIGTFAVMKLLNFSIDNLSLMALTVSTGFVVDDAVVVIENITRHIENGKKPMAAAFAGAKEIGFTVLSISLSLVAVFIPILLMGGIVGRLLREFAITLSIAILVSLVLSLTTTPMLCSILLSDPKDQKHGRLYETSEKIFQAIIDFYKRTLTVVLDHPGLTLGVLALTIAANVLLIKLIPKGFFPQQDNGLILGSMQGSQDISFQSMDTITQKFVNTIKADPAVDNVVGFTGGKGATNGGFVYIALKDLKERKISSDQVIARLRPKFSKINDANLFLQAGQDVRIGGRQSNAQYQYTLQSENANDLEAWGPKLLAQMKKIPGLTDVNSDQQNKGLKAMLTYDRETASRLGLTPTQIDAALYQNFGQSLATTLYTDLNQYYVVLESAPSFTQSIDGLKNVYLPTANGPVPLSVVAKIERANSALAVNHQGQFPSATVSFNLPPGVSLGEASAKVEAAEAALGMPSTLHGLFSGTAEAFKDSLANEKILILMALFAVYIVLGVLYESLIHPITILSTLPSAGVGAVLILMLFHMELNIVAFIGIILLIGIVKKNAILMIDFALAAERGENKSPRDAIFEACVLRFRPILMTTMAALFGAVPLAFGSGMGSELRRPLGIAIIGGLIVSQVLTLYTTPVVYLMMDRLRATPQTKTAPSLKERTA